ncbi:MAG: hypothetical protein ACI9NC_004969, partial [Verrucomicrobiales bacterium]
TGLTSIAIPGSVERLEPSPFQGCSSMVCLVVDPQNQTFASSDGIVFNKSFSEILRYPQGKNGSSYNIPPGITSIGRGAFYGCDQLSDINFSSGVSVIGSSSFNGCGNLSVVTLPDSIIEVGPGSFEACDALLAVIFLGDAPDLTGHTNTTFADTASGFTLRYLSGSMGFTSPTWFGYPAISIDESSFPPARWLLEHGLRHDANLHQDLNGDGVSLLVAYALDLDPNLNLQSALPRPVLSSGSLSLSYHSISPGITYTVEASADLKNWSSHGVAVSAEPPALHRASVDLDSPLRFMRLLIED